MSVYLERLRKLNDSLNLLNELNELLYVHAEYLECIDEIRTERKWWVKPTNNNREQQGAANNLVKEITCYEPETFFNFTRLNMENFNKLLSIVGPDLVKHSIRESINPQSRLLLTLRFLATGDSFKSMHYLYRMGESTVRSIVYETCEIIFRKLNEQYVAPSNKEEFENTSRSFQSRTKIPHVIGAIDGKHIAIFSPPKSGTQYYNYKKHFSIVLLGVCDNSYRFIYYNVGGFGSESDGGLFKKSSLCRALEQNQLDMPEPRRTNGSDFEVPFFLLGDAAFPLRPYLLTPYSGRNLTRSQEKYNLELSKGRSMIENTFGILSARWRVLLKRIQVYPENADKIVLACILLHNFIIKENIQQYIPPTFVDRYENNTLIEGEWRQSVGDTMLSNSHNNTQRRINPRTEAAQLRDKIKELLFSNV